MTLCLVSFLKASNSLCMPAAQYEAHLLAKDSRGRAEASRCACRVAWAAGQPPARAAGPSCHHT